MLEYDSMPATQRGIGVKMQPGETRVLQAVVFTQPLPGAVRLDCEAIGDGGWVHAQLQIAVEATDSARDVRVVQEQHLDVLRCALARCTIVRW